MCAALISKQRSLNRESYTFTAKRYAFTYTKKGMELDHEKLDGYKAALDFSAWAYTVCRPLKALDREATCKGKDLLVRFVAMRSLLTMRRRVALVLYAGAG